MTEIETGCKRVVVIAIMVATESTMEVGGDTWTVKICDMAIERACDKRQGLTWSCCHRDSNAPSHAFPRKSIPRPCTRLRNCTGRQHVHCIC
ncbi:hypothetical protein KC363_g26 [Hortaea werneckii]|nr:hypothetical protein KC363_g26 [Hortaea werneckii]